MKIDICSGVKYDSENGDYITYNSDYGYDYTMGDYVPVQSTEQYNQWGGAEEAYTLNTNFTPEILSEQYFQWSNVDEAVMYKD